MSAIERKQLTDILGTISMARRDAGDVPALEYQPAEVLDADFTEVDEEITDSELAEAIPY